MLLHFDFTESVTLLFKVLKTLSNLFDTFSVHAMIAVADSRRRPNVRYFPIDKKLYVIDEADQGRSELDMQVAIVGCDWGNAVHLLDCLREPLDCVRPKSSKRGDVVRIVRRANRAHAIWAITANGIVIVCGGNEFWKPFREHNATTNDGLEHYIRKNITRKRQTARSTQRFASLRTQLPPSNREVLR